MWTDGGVTHNRFAVACNLLVPVALALFLLLDLLILDLLYLVGAAFFVCNGGLSASVHVSLRRARDVGSCSEAIGKC